MKDIILALFGAYEPLTIPSAVSTVADGVAASETVDAVVSGVAGLDWPWIMGVLLFIVVLWSFFRLVGILLSK